MASVATPFNWRGSVDDRFARVAFLLQDSPSALFSATYPNNRTCKKVVAIDIDEERLKICQHNAKVYGVFDRIEFVLGDYLSLIPTLR